MDNEMKAREMKGALEVSARANTAVRQAIEGCYSLEDPKLATYGTDPGMAA